MTTCFPPPVAVRIKTWLINSAGTYTAAIVYATAGPGRTKAPMARAALEKALGIGGAARRPRAKIPNGPSPMKSLVLIYCKSGLPFGLSL